MGGNDIMKFCPFCGFKLNGGEKFCPSCGKPLPNAEASSSQPVPPQQTPQARPAQPVTPVPTQAQQTTQQTTSTTPPPVQPQQNSGTVPPNHSGMASSTKILIGVVIAGLCAFAVYFFTRPPKVEPLNQKYLAQVNTYHDYFEEALYFKADGSVVRYLDDAIIAVGTYTIKESTGEGLNKKEKVELTFEDDSEEATLTNNRNTMTIDSEFLLDYLDDNDELSEYDDFDSYPEIFHYYSTDTSIKQHQEKETTESSDWFY